MTARETEYTSLTATATRLGIPRKWLKDEAEAGRMPHIKTGRRLLFSIGQVRDTLTRRAERQVTDATT